MPQPGVTIRLYTKRPGFFDAYTTSATDAISDADVPRATDAPVPCEDIVEGERVTEMTDHTERKVMEADEYIRSVPTRLARAKIQHQPKKRAASWHVPRSRKRRCQARCAVTRSGTQIHHAQSLKAKKIHDLLRIDGVKSHLDNLRARRPAYKAPATDDCVFLSKQLWPPGIEEINECKMKGIRFPGLGSYHKCRWTGDCFWDSCDSVDGAAYCTPACCKLKARCGNAPVNRKTLKLLDTNRVGLGVYTTTSFDVGDMVGEYTGGLSEWAAKVQGQPDQALKQNSGYTLLYPAKSVNKEFVFVDALKSGSVTRFISHACDTNAVFVDMQNRKKEKVLIRMINDVKAGAVITVHYRDERWFVYACDGCWNARAAGSETQ
ncbi:hypothetical protein PC129_g17132 [Phytophthora cactorum]|uniref:SET domain-containing protein n=1 Tax=Phytophthora cactorum TaxID=29920 RepID=A0A329S8E0_9STRA|nr:hypothetical protein Pcac1_g4971 [Phytophthora cactorum]KAG2815541.1 hypothetical protein PC112_g13829 [Phytophthora cactorum]KAG2826995.1 hypothetical protein PC111_g8758 [Phytophthora cactorum]KAG2853489.1 hypothetical protein PC113_g14120 [Phytophthora cactorum]KAG2896653.1 hypothetical protein PC114_g14990 [Phytophthora cactorum]